MRYELMLPQELREAIDGGYPFVLPLGVLEYHGEHLALGLDTIVVQRCLERLEEKRPDMVILPAFYYGAGSYVVEPPERNGTIDVRPPALEPFATELFASLLRVGCRNVHVVIHHQTENFVAGMPTDLAFKTAARTALFKYLQQARGEGWWGQSDSSTYYESHAEGDNPFNWVNVHPLMDEDIISKYDFDHAGIGETSLLMALQPEGVNMDRLDLGRWYIKGAEKASREYGEFAVAMILDRLDALLFGSEASQ